MMPKAFRDEIHAALGNPALGAALDANAERRQAIRHKAYRSLPDPDGLRKRAHAVRADVITNLEGYLSRFITQAQANGLIVHQAASAQDAAEIVLKILQENQAQVVAKAKTMVSEEIELNQTLENAGLQVVETDLGEYIVQLRGEKPAHIITPAVHLSRQQVGETFHQKLGTPLTENIPSLTAIARRELRQLFLRADAGVSGVNFGVAESGTLCVVTNEGNGRMVTTLPRLHIALMGIERLVPTLDDLSLMLTLLPRAATGQQITVYVNLINGPRRSGEPDGAIQRHLVLVDNGRLALRESPLADALMCIRCGACLNACPIFREIGGHAYVSQDGAASVYSGPIGSIISPGLFGQAAFGHLARASTLCGACQEACPVDINLPQLLLRTRAGGAQATAQPKEAPGALSWGLRLYTWLATDPGRFSLAQRLAATLAKVLPGKAGWLQLPAFTGWGASRLLPRPAARPFRQQFKAEYPTLQAKGQRDLPLKRPGQTEVDSDVIPDPEDRTHAIDQDTLATRFAAELTALDGTCTQCSERDLAKELIRTLKTKDVTKILAWNESAFPPDLLNALTAAGISVDHHVHLSEQNEEGKAIIPTVGLTGASAAIAETGSLILVGGAGRPHTASLLPDIHLAVLRKADIYENLPQALRLQEIRESASVILISGPSRTADIEMTLTIGVHGPKEVHVFVVD